MGVMPGLFSPYNMTDTNRNLAQMSAGAASNSGPFQVQAETLQGINQQKLAAANNANALRLGQLQANTALGTANIAAEASKYPAQLRQQRFDQVFPFVTGQFQNLAGQLGQVGGGAAGGGPTINATGVYTPEQTQQQVNSMRAGNDQQAQSQTRQAAQGLAGKGFGSQSPLLAALQAQYQGQAQQASTQGENDLRFQAAGANASQLLKGQQAQEAQFASRQQEATQRAAVQAQQFSALLFRDEFQQCSKRSEGAPAGLGSDNQTDIDT